mmetsp:Transcript_26176/g.69858  ORF Transcript_26176/g.69858 Transcript_26176/m.69858 type:complete len:216 (-) Transcript_26176:126-773(-)
MRSGPSRDRALVDARPAVAGAAAAAEAEIGGGVEHELATDGDGASARAVPVRPAGSRGGRVEAGATKPRECPAPSPCCVSWRIWSDASQRKALPRTPRVSHAATLQQVQRTAAQLRHGRDDDNHKEDSHSARRHLSVPSGCIVDLVHDGSQGLVRREVECLVQVLVDVHNEQQYENVFQYCSLGYARRHDVSHRYCRSGEGIEDEHATNEEGTPQ